MTIEEKMRTVFAGVPERTEFTAAEIIERVHTQFGTNKASIIPSDFCYNRLNNGIDYHKHLHLFEYISEKRYLYLGICNYNGSVFHKLKNVAEKCVGQVKNGVFCLHNCP